MNGSRIAEVAQETARRTNGQFGEQHLADPGPEAISTSQPLPASPLSLLEYLDAGTVEEAVLEAFDGSIRYDQDGLKRVADALQRVVLKLYDRDLPKAGRQEPVRPRPAETMKAEVLASLRTRLATQLAGEWAGSLDSAQLLDWVDAQIALLTGGAPADAK